MRWGVAAGSFRRAWFFSRFLAARFGTDQCLATAGALSYTTLLSLVPLLAVVFAVASAFPVFETAIAKLNDFVFLNFVPASGEVIQRYLQRFAQQAGRLTGAGLVLLVLTAVILVQTIDGAVNRIWRVQHGRRLVLRLVVYWAVLTLGPMLLAVSIAISSYLASLPLMSGLGEAAGGAGLLALMPFLSTTLGLAVLYVVVPNCRVPVGTGFAAAVCAAVLFELAKKGFAAYVASVPVYTTIYGALGIIPLFLVWIYVSWVVVLFGVELTYALTAFRGGRVHEAVRPELPALVVAFRVIGHLRQAQRHGGALSTLALLEREPALRHEALNEVLGLLERRRLIRRTDTGAWVLARDTAELTLGDLYRMFPRPVHEPAGAWGQADAWNRALCERLTRCRKAVDAALDVPLKPLYQCGEMHAVGQGARNGGPATGGSGATARDDT